VQQYSNLGLIRVWYARSFIVCDCTFRFLLIKHNDLFALAAVCWMWVFLLSVYSYPFTGWSLAVEIVTPRSNIKSWLHLNIYPIKFDLFRCSAKHILLVNLSISVYNSFRKWNLVQSTINCRRLSSPSNSSNTRGFNNFNSNRYLSFLMNFDRVSFSMMHFNLIRSVLYLPVLWSKEGTWR
jgi:hypothetical protein